MSILIASHNDGKVDEYRALLKSQGCELVSLNQVGIAEKVPETGHTFAANALQKAREYARRADLVTLADDSGLEVDALGGAPGIYSARFAGPEATDEERCVRLLEKLDGIPIERRTARFRCAIALVMPKGSARVVQGVCEGYIAQAMHGEYGFGYDPIFVLPSLGRTMAELTTEEKNRLSHRALATQKASLILERWQ